MNIFVLSVQFEGEDALEAFGDITATLRSQLKKMQSRAYTDEITKLKIYLGVGGSLGDFVESNGCHSVSFYGDTCIVDVVMHKEIWEKGELSIVNFLGNQVRQAFVKIVNTMKARKMHVNGKKLIDDITSVIDQWQGNYS
ncbi:MAG: hypothetical protein PF637_12505 [Spirochaetes bacterium]|nr:hypothetical protein [Spirochaetota bacterium]